MTHPSAARESLRWKHEGVNCVPSLRPRLNLGLLHVVPIDCPDLSCPAPPGSEMSLFVRFSSSATIPGALGLGVTAARDVGVRWEQFC